MNTLWALGNSFVVNSISERNYHDDTWVCQVADKLNLNPQFLGKSNTDLAYAYSTFNQCYRDFKQGDVVIIALASTSRKIFNTDNIKAIKQYHLYLDNTNLEYTHLENFHYAANYIAKKMNVKCIILNCYEDTRRFLITKTFDNLHIVNYCLLDLSLDEIKLDLRTKLLANKICESRTNHLCKSNHIILADKVVDYIKHNKDIDLRTGFKKDIMGFESKYDKAFCDYELFGMEWEFT